MIENHVDLDCVAEFDNSEDLLAGLLVGSADVLSIDFLAKDFSIDTVVAAKQICPTLKIVAITPDQSGHTIVNALRAGVDSYVKKDCSIEEVVEALEETAQGSAFFCGQILDRIKKDSIDLDDANGPASCDPIQLSNRELEVIVLISEGYTNVKIAERLFLSGHTVNTHRKNIMQKLGVNNTAALVMYAVKNGLVSPNKFLFQGQA
jgi:DNA-binding NarL/FixJ family response regulator